MSSPIRQMSLSRCSTLLLVALCSTSAADDTELYLGQMSNTTTQRPKVLVILDNSGSMLTDVPGTKPAYDSTTTYATQGNVSSNWIYWATDGSPPGTGSDHYFLADSNRCAASTAILNTTGTYTDFMTSWRPKNSILRWRTLNDSEGARESSYVDCKVDVDTNLGSNPGTPAAGDGYPLSTSAGPYTASTSDVNVNWGDMGTRSLYTANYMNWYHNDSLALPTKTRIDIAKEVVTSIIDSNPTVDFGLMVFNRNGDGQPNGGRLIRKIVANMTDSQRTTLKTTVGGISAETWTPLCETLYESYRYYGGKSVYFGDDETVLTPSRDTTAESSGSYISPMGDCQQAYIILMTDGEPTRDTSADSLIDALPGIGSVSGSRLDELAGWMYRTDLDGDSSNGTQRVVTYTIGFATDQTLLSLTASKGGGRYYTASSSTQLQDAFQGALNEILSTDATFTAPSVAVNSFNRTRSLDDVYIAMFRPDSRPRWPGNLKKLRIDSSGVLIDADGVPAIDPVTGDIKETAKTLWNSTPDGGHVTKGGVGGVLVARDPGTRVIKTNSGSNGALEVFTTSNTNLTAADFGASSDVEKNALINWARGVDVDDEDEDESSTDTRPWILGDPLHSRPLVINYGARGSYTSSNPDVRIIMGTNAGFLHMFKAADGSEAWAILPKEMAPLLKTLRGNGSSDAHPYGIDGTAVTYLLDANGDGTLSGAGEVAYLFVGLRRGGSSYYGFNITDPDNPIFMWCINGDTAGLAELGQSWSTPVITKIPGHDGPTLIFGAGYDVNKDADVVGTDDSEGRGVVIVDALTGGVIWSATPAANSTTNLQVNGLTDSIAAPVAVLDSNGDHLTDRIYAADTGGNVWRIDMPGAVLPGSAQTTWSMFKLASFGGTTAATDRRFFNKPDVVRTRYETLAFDAVALGSGDRSSPLETAVVNRFYLVRDTEIAASYHGSGGTAIPTVLTENNLYNATSNAIQDGTSSEKTIALTALAASRGWYVTLERSGEKNLAPAITLSGTLFFTTFAPDANAISCVPVPGIGHLYAISMQHGSAVYNWELTSTSTTVTKSDRTVAIGQRLPDAVTPHFGEDQIRIIGVGAGDEGSGSYETGVNLQTRGIYWYQVDH